MAEPIRKPAQDKPDVAKPAKPSGAKLAAFADDGGHVTAVPSPARDMQRRLAAHFSPVSQTWMTRYVTLLIMFAAIGVLTSGVGTPISV